MHGISEQASKLSKDSFTFRVPIHVPDLMWDVTKDAFWKARHRRLLEMSGWCEQERILMHVDISDEDHIRPPFSTSVVAYFCFRSAPDAVQFTLRWIGS